LLEAHGGDCTKGTAGSSKQRELFLRLQTKILNERASKKLAATAAQPNPMSQSGWELRESHKGSCTSAVSCMAGGLSVLSFFKLQGAIEG
jgi:hypothetical protein